MKLRKLLLLLSVLFAGLCLSACGDNDEPSYATSPTAYVGYKTIDGTVVKFYVTSNPQTMRCRFHITYDGNHREKEFYEDLSQVGRTVQVYSDNSIVYITRNSASQLSLADNNYTVILDEVDGNSYWQNQYDETEALCVGYYNEYINKSVRFPDLSLYFAQSLQEFMVRIHNWAEGDSFHIVVSPWETKQL